MPRIDPKHIRYIKLGPGGAWADRCLNQGEIHFGHKLVPHELCQAGDWDGAAELLVKAGRSRSKAKDHVREIREFYGLGADCLWITFARRQLWWAFADPAVTWLGPDDQVQGARFRSTIDGWRNTNLRGKALTVDGLSSRLTQVAAYRQTLCRVQDEAYLLRRINGEEEPIVTEAREARQAMTGVARAMIAQLHWAEFESMVDLIFARSGWQRVSRLGGTQADVDLVVELPTTGEKASVQVKSKADAASLTEYVGQCGSSGVYERMFFVCHSFQGALPAEGDPKLHVLTGDQLAEMAIKSGLYDWLIERSA